MSVTNTKNKGEQVQQTTKHWRIKSAVLAVAILAGGLSVSAQALVLGQVKINSSLGEPVKAQIPVTKISSDEGTSLVVKLAAGDDFAGRGLIYNAAVRNMHVDFKMTGATTGVITVTGKKPVQDPFVDLLLDVTWRTGSTQRSYTMLFDPPDEVMQNAVYTSQASPTETGTATAGTSGIDQPVSSSGSYTGVAVESETRADGTRHIRIGSTTPSGDIVEPALKGEKEPASRGTNKAPAVQAERPSPSSASSEFSVTVSKGQTLGQIASSMKPDGVTQEQMLIALFRANPKAFINGNINWLRAGVTLNIPSESDIAAISQKEARREVSKHTQRFNERRLGAAQGGVSTVTPKNNDKGQTTTGSVSTEPKVESRAETNPELTITSGGSSEQMQSDAKGAQEAQANYATEHIAVVKEVGNELEAAQQEADRIAGNKTETGNTETGAVTAAEQNNTGSGSDPVQPVIDSSAPQTPTENALGEGVVQPGEAPLVEDDSAEQARIAAEKAAAEEAARIAEEQKRAEDEARIAKEAEERRKTDEAAAQAAAQTPVQTEEPGLIEKMLENPLIPIGALVGIALVLFLVMKAARRRKENDVADDSSLEDTSINDSFFVDNAEESSMLDQSSSIYAASQLDTNADVDPLQEADVYLAYGRDEQAAEILRDAIQSEPERAALHVKLCEIYAKQGDHNQFNAQVNKLRQITGGQGDDWARVEKLVQEMSGEETVQPSATATTPPAGFASNFAPPAQPAAQDKEAAQPRSSAAQKPAAVKTALPDLEMPDIGVSLDKPGASAAFTASASPFSVNDPVSEILDDEEGPSTRLALAEEFLAIGNKGDAKEIVEEVLEEDLSEDLRGIAQNLLNKASS